MGYTQWEVKICQSPILNIRLMPLKPLLSQSKTQICSLQLDIKRQKGEKMEAIFTIYQQLLMIETKIPLVLFDSLFYLQKEP